MEERRMAGEARKGNRKWKQGREKQRRHSDEKEEDEKGPEAQKKGKRIGRRKICRKVGKNREKLGRK